MPSPKKQKKMNREVLEQNGIYFEENVDRIGPLPVHAQSLRSSILDFDCTIPDRLSCEKDDELQVLELEGFPDIRMTEFNRRHIVETLQRCVEARHDAKKLALGEDREAEWVGHYKKWFFDPLSEASQVKDEDIRQYVCVNNAMENLDKLSYYNQDLAHKVLL
jgi:hypothetical protein